MLKSVISLSQTRSENLQREMDPKLGNWTELRESDLAPVKPGRVGPSSGGAS